MSEFRPTNPDGSPMTAEQIEEEKRQSQLRAQHVAGDAASGEQLRAEGLPDGSGPIAGGIPGDGFRQDGGDTTSRNAGNMPQTGVTGSNPNTGLTGSSTTTAMPGIQGFFGATEDYPVFTPTRHEDPNYQANRALLESTRTAAGQTPTQGMTGATIAAGPQDAARANALGVRGQQLSLADMLSQSASGKGGPSAAEAMLRRGTDASMRAAQSLAKSSRANPAVAMKAALGQQADTFQRSSNDAAILRAQEQQQAQQALGGVLAGTRAGDEAMRGQDIGLALGQAQFDQDASKTNLLSSVEQQKMRDELVQKYTQMGLSLDQANYQADLQQRQYSAGVLNQAIAASKGVSMQNSAQGAQLAGNALGALATAISGIGG